MDESITDENYWSFILATVDDERIPDDGKIWKSNNITVGMIRKYLKVHPNDRIQFASLPQDVAIFSAKCTLFFRIILNDTEPNGKALESVEKYADEHERA